MTKEPLRWQPEILSGTTTDAIVDKLKELVPGFKLDTFVAKAQKYFSYDDLAEEEYYPHVTFSEEDDDFIWMACNELWKRLAPDRPAVEHVAGQLDNIVEELIKAGER